MKKIKRGRPINIAAVIRTREYAKRKLTIIEIAKKMRKDQKQIRRWLSYDVD